MYLVSFFDEEPTINYTDDHKSMIQNLVPVEEVNSKSQQVV